MPLHQCDCRDRWDDFARKHDSECRRTGFYRRLNDLWKYSPASGAWTWIGGANTFDATGVYGVRGVAAATNVPGARAAPFRWKDASGNVWLFGGYQYDDATNTRFEMNDLWVYPMQ